MNQDQFKDRLLAREQEALTRIQRAMNTVRESGDGAAQDAGDESVRRACRLRPPATLQEGPGRELASVIAPGASREGARRRPWG